MVIKLNYLWVLLVLSLSVFYPGLPTPAATKEHKAAKHSENAQRYMDAQKPEKSVIELKNILQISPKDDRAYYELGLVYLDLKKFKEAFESFWKAAYFNPANLRAHLELGKMYLQLKKLKDARIEADRILSRAPENYEALTLAADISIREGDYAAAVKDLNKVASLYPEDSKTQLLLGRLHLIQGNMDAADKSNLMAALLDPSLGWMIVERPDTRYRSIPVLARFYETQKQWDAAERLHLIAVKSARDKVGVYKDLAAFYARIEDYHKALNAINQAFSLREDLDTLIFIGNLHYRFNKIKEAERVADNILTLYGNHVDGNLLKGRLYALEKEYDGALECFDRALKESPRTAEAHYYRGLALEGKGKIGNALEALEKAVELKTDLLEARLKLVELYLRYHGKENLNLAGKHLQSALEAQPTNASAMILLGNLNVKTRNFTNAYAIYRRVLELHPQNASAHFSLGYLYYAAGQDEKALSFFKDAIRFNPMQMNALSCIIDIYLKNETYDAALDLCREHETKVGKDGYLAAALENHRGRIYLAMEDLEKAREHYEAAVEKDPGSLASHMTLTKLYLHHQNIRQAISHFEGVLEKNPKYVPGYMILGILHDLKGDGDIAESFYRKALEINEEFIPAANNLAWSLADRNINMDEALRLAKLAKSKRPVDPQISDTLGWIYYKLGYHGKAIIELELSVSLEPRNVTYAYHLGKAYDANKQPDKAKELLQKALSLDPNFNGAQDARQTLKKYRSLDG